MSNNDSNWTTVTTKTKAKTAPTSTKSAPAPVIPKAEVKTIKLSDSAFSSMKDRIRDENDENQPSEVKTPKPVSNTVKPTKPSKPNSTSLSLKQALQNVNLDKLKQLYKSSKDNTSLWVDKTCFWFIDQFKDVTSGYDDPLFAKESQQEYPLSALPSTVRDYFNEIFDTQSKLKGITLCRNAIVNPNTDAKHIAAHQVLLQYFLRNLNEKAEQSFLDDVDNLAALAKRYPSDKVLRLFWAYSQVQYEQPGLALNIWFRLMFPFIENRTYNQFIVENLSQITSRNLKPNKFLSSTELFPLASYVKLLDFLDRPNPALSKDLRKSLTKSANILSELFLKHSKNLSENGNEYFQILFPILQENKQRSNDTQSIIDRMILACLQEKSISKTWLNLQKDYPQNSLYLLSLLQTTNSEVFSTKDLRKLIQQLRTVSNENNSAAHKEFLRVYEKTDTVVVNKRAKGSKSRVGSIFKLIVLLSLGYTIYANWLWLTVASEYFLEDYLKHPTAIIIRERLTDGFGEVKKLTGESWKVSEAYLRKTFVNLEPYAIQFGQTAQKQWTLALKYIEGPIYDKSIEIAEQIQHLSIVVFKQSVHYLNIFFEQASYYANLYAQQIYDQWSHFDFSKLQDKFDQIRMRVIKSV